MAVRIIQLGTPREAGEGPRIGTVRHPPRGVPKSEFSSGNWYDVWFPEVSPSQEIIHELKQAPDEAGWKNFARHYRSEMKAAPASHALDLLATLSQHADFAVGCYCRDESRCHRSILRELLAERGAKLA